MAKNSQNVKSMKQTAKKGARKNIHTGFKFRIFPRQFTHEKSEVSVHKEQCKKALPVKFKVFKISNEPLFHEFNGWMDEEGMNKNKHKKLRDISDGERTFQ